MWRRDMGSGFRTEWCETRGDAADGAARSSHAGLLYGGAAGGRVWQRGWSARCSCGGERKWRSYGNRHVSAALIKELIVGRAESTTALDVGKRGLVESDVSGDDDFVGGEVKAAVSLMMRRIAEEDAHGGTGRKLVGGSSCRNTCSRTRGGGHRWALPYGEQDAACETLRFWKAGCCASR